MTIVKIPTWYYQNHDADYSLSIPAKGYGGWKKEEMELNLDKTALVIMHAWETGDELEFPGWYNCVEMLYRAKNIGKEYMPKIIEAVRKSKMKIYHVVGENDNKYYEKYEGYKRAVKYADGKCSEVKKVVDCKNIDSTYHKLQELKIKKAFPGELNLQDVKEGFKQLDFMKGTKPLEDEGISKNAEQFAGLLREDGINHIIYTGFAVNWCLFQSPGGMNDMNKRGLICSVIKQCVTAVENKETAEKQLNKENALWKISMDFGYVYDIHDFIKGIG